MKKVLAIILSCLMLVCVCGTMTGCSFIDAFDQATELEELRVSLDEAQDRIEELETENATLRFNAKYPDHIIGGEDNVELLKVNLEVEGDGDAVTVVDKAQVTINGGSYNGGQTSFGGAGNTAVWVNSKDAKVIINEGYFTIKGLAINEDGVKDNGHIDLIYCSAGVIEINGGLFEGADSDVWLLNCKDQQYKDGTAQIIVKGGTFINFDPSDCISEGEHTNFVAEGYGVIVIVNNEGTAEEYTEYRVVPESELPSVEEPAPEEPEGF